MSILCEFTFEQIPYPAELAGRAAIVQRSTLVR
jgi:hypothetical protein